MFGTCDICGKEDDLYSVGEMDLCRDCIGEHYILCDHCQEYYTKEDTIVYYLKDERVMCEDCAIYALNFSGLTDDNIDHIEGPAEYLEED